MIHTLEAFVRHTATLRWLERLPLGTRWVPVVDLVWCFEEDK